MVDLELLLLERRRLELSIELKFREVFPELPARMKKGRVQTIVLSLIGLIVNRDNRKAVNAVLLELGYEHRKIDGHLFYCLKSIPRVVQAQQRQNSLYAQQIGLST